MSDARLNMNGGWRQEHKQNCIGHGQAFMIY